MSEPTKTAFNNAQRKALRLSQKQRTALSWASAHKLVPPGAVARLDALRDEGGIKPWDAVCLVNIEGACA